MLDIRYTLFFTALLPIVTFIFALFYKETKSKSLPNSFPTQHIWSALFAFILTAVIVLFALNSKPWIPGLKNETLSTLAIILIWGTWILAYISHLIKKGLSTTTLLFAAFFLFLWRFTPSFGAPWSDYFINTLKLSQEKLGFIATISSLSWIIGSYIYNRFLDKYPLKKLLFWTVLVGVILSFSQLIIATPTLANTVGSFWVIKYFSAIMLFPVYLVAYQGEAWNTLMQQPGILNLDAFLSFFLETLFIISFLPLLKLAAVVTPKGVEATNFSILASIMNLGLAFGAISGGWIYTYIEGTHHFAGLTFNGLHLTIIIGALSSLLCLPILKKLNDLS